MSSVVFKKKKHNISVDFEISKTNFENEIKLNLLTLSRLELIDKRTFPHMVIISPPYSGADKVIEIYRHIVQEKQIFGQECGFLELTFPIPEKGEESFDRFFQSPKQLVMTSNHFSGVFAINFEEWKCEKLIKSVYFEKLLDFVKNNNEITCIYDKYIATYICD